MVCYRLLIKTRSRRSECDVIYSNFNLYAKITMSKIPPPIKFRKYVVDLHTFIISNSNIRIHVFFGGLFEILHQIHKFLLPGSQCEMDLFQNEMKYQLKIFLFQTLIWPPIEYISKIFL